jgi:hypothetical protein
MSAEDGFMGAPEPGPTAQDTGPPLFMLSGLADGLEFGVLRRNFSGRVNRADEWVHRKLHPDASNAPSAEAISWAPTCRRFDVLLPQRAPDTFLNPAVLLHTFEAEAGHVRKDLVVHVKLTVLDEGPLHLWWERARAFAAMFMVGDPALPVVLALHDPAMTVMRRPPRAHIHIMAPARRLGPSGWGQMTDLATDAAHSIFARSWNNLV